MNKVIYFIGILFIAGAAGQYLNAESADSGRLVPLGAGAIGSMLPNEPIKKTSEEVVKQAGQLAASEAATTASKDTISYWQKATDIMTTIKKGVQPGLTMIRDASVSTYKASGRFLSHLYNGKENEASILSGGVQLGVGCYAGDVVGREICHMAGIDSASYPIATEIIQKGSMVGGGIASLVAHDAGYNICNHPYLFILLSIVACKGDNALSRIKNATMNNKITSGVIAAGALAYSYAQGLDISALGRSFIENGQCNPLASVKNALLESPWKSAAIVGGAFALVGCYKSFYKVQMRHLIDIYNAVTAYEHAVSDEAKEKAIELAFNNAALYRNIFGFKVDYYTEGLKGFFGQDRNGNPCPKLYDLNQIHLIIFGVEPA